jgi:Fic family protein
MKMPEKAPTMATLMRTLSSDPEMLRRVVGIGPVVRGRYEHWDRLRHLPAPDGLDVRDWWLGLKLARAQLLRETPLRGTDGRPFRVATPDSILRLLHEIDQRAGGRVEVPEEIVNPATRDRYVIDSLIEESITSSQLEGASTTAQVAEQMLRPGRKPTDKSEQMIFNNYRAMQFVREKTRTTLTPDFVFELHRILAENTLDDPAKAGACRTDADQVVVERRGVVIHVPPPAGELPERLRLMCAFANDRPADLFIHPVVRAVVLHFWLAYDHPFVDGNGRTARAIFYWSMLSQGYWLTEFLSISRILRQAPAQYARAFLLTETDEKDLTYFLEHQLRVIRRAIAELNEDLARKAAELREVEALLRHPGDLNHRQLDLVRHALGHPGFVYTIASHQRSHVVVYQTARTDLLDLARRGFLRRSRRGKAYVFSAPPNMAERLRGGRRLRASPKAGEP